MARFQDQSTYLVEFLDEVWVQCPRCEGPARVLCAMPYWRSVPSFRCSHCATVFRGRYSRWFGPIQGVAVVACGRCGRRLRRVVDGTKGTTETVGLTCPGCNAVSTGSVHWSYDLSGQPYEPSFGLTLRLQAPCRDKVLWFYNLRHLSFIKAYVASSLRERVPNTISSLVSRLPLWIKAAKHRGAVLKVIARTEASVARKKRSVLRDNDS